jgi:tRNA uridine 5-carboxymethylaminomethyl modification enzyme
VLIDDLIRHGVDEPYRIFTSRAEYRLALRHDNADERLRRYGRDIGLVGDSDWERYNQRRDRIAKVKRSLKETRLRKRDAAYLAISGIVGGELGDSINLAELAKRRGIGLEVVRKLLPVEVQSTTNSGDLEFALADDLYFGYIKVQEATARRLRHHDSTPIPANLNFRALNGLSHEMVERLERTRPTTFGQARSIPGLTAAALATLLVSVSAAP